MGRARKNLKLEQRIEVARRFAAGQSAKDLAVVFGISPRQVNRLAKEEAGEGLKVRDPSEAVAFRASASVLAAFDAEWRARGYANRSQALSAVLRGRCGFLDVPRDLVAEFCASWRQSKEVSDAGLVLAKAVHRGKLTVSQDDHTVLVELLDLSRAMSRDLGKMKDAALALRGQPWPRLAGGGVDASDTLQDAENASSRGAETPKVVPLSGGCTSALPVSKRIGSGEDQTPTGVSAPKQQGVRNG